MITISANLIGKMTLFLCKLKKLVKNMNPIKTESSTVDIFRNRSPIKSLNFTTIIK